MDIVVRPASQSTYQLEMSGMVMRCAVGRGGLIANKREGDGGTPIGKWPLREVFYRQDRVPKPETRLPLRAISPRDAWCDDPSDARYNHLVTLASPAHWDRLWRDDHLYDVVIVVGYNDNPVVPGKGSAIFLHLCRSDYAPTAGCIAVPLEKIGRILALCEPGSMITIAPR